jgi:hypothetical protein
MSPAIVEKSVLFVGIDPGISGGICVLTESLEIKDLWSVPVIHSTNMIDRKGLVHIFLQIRARAKREGCSIQVFLEQGIPFPGQSCISTHTSGKIQGYFEILCDVFKFSLRTPRPQDWMKRLHLSYGSKDKAKKKPKPSIVYVLRAYPVFDWPMNNKSKLSGLTDAVCIAEYGARYSAQEYEKPKPKKG